MAAACVIADLRSYRLAAGRLNTTQPTLSRLVHHAEWALGTALFHRGWSGTDLTSQGEDVIRFRIVVALLDEAEAALFTTLAPHPTLHRSPRLRHLDMVEAVGRIRGVSAAAAALGCSQPDVRRSLTQTAPHLGLALFRCTRSGTEPLEPARHLALLRGRIGEEIAQGGPRSRRGRRRDSGRRRSGDAIHRRRELTEYRCCDPR